MKPINVGLLGLGTVAGGIYSVLRRNAQEITRRAGRPIAVSVVAELVAVRRETAPEKGWEEAGRARH